MTAVDALPRPFGRYQLVDVLGEGGMARVYKARLAGPSGFSKTLAVKVVHEDLTRADGALRRALVTEARIGGLLKHPHIVDIYDFGEADGRHFVAMEWIDGVDAGALLERGPLPPRRALDVAIALAEALDYLHTLAGDDGPLRLVHRDIKPSNVLLGRRGEIKLMDFGVARGDGLSEVKTATGIAKGSAPWMSPEQALAQPLDGRSDLFALGTVLFELVAGRRFNDQPTVTAVVAGLLAVEDRIVPGGELDGLDALAPGLADVVRRCLRRDPADRYPDAEALAAELRPLRSPLPEGAPLAERVAAHLSGQHAAASFAPTEEVSSEGLAPGPAPLVTPRPASPRPASPPPPGPVPPGPDPIRPAGRRWPLALGLLLAVAVVVGALVRSGGEPSPEPLPRVRSTLVSAPGWLEGEPGLSPDGTRVVFVRIIDGGRTLVHRDLRTDEERPLAPGDLRDLSHPAWSRDGTQLALSARLPRRGLYTLAMEEGTAVPVRVAEEGGHPDFSPDGARIAYSTEPIARPLAKRGRAALTVVELDTLERRVLVEADANQPKWSPDGKRIAYWGVDEAARRNVWTVDVRTGEATAVTTGDAVDWNPVWAPDGEHLYFLSDREGGSGLHRIRIDPTTGAPLGPPASLGSALQAVPGQLSVDPAGRWIAFDTSLAEENVQLLALDGDGRAAGPASWLTRGTRTVAWSEPESGGERVAWVEQRREVEDVWVGPADGGEPRRLTDDPFRDRMPKWLGPDRVVFYSNRGGGWGLWWIDAAGGEPVQVDPEGNTSTFALHPDGRALATALQDAAEIAVLELDADGREVGRRRALFDRPAHTKPRPSSWSPDGRRLIVEAASAERAGRWVGAWTPQTGEVEAGDPGISLYRWVTDDVVIGARGGEVVRFAWPDGEPEVIHEVPEGASVGWLGLSADRRFLTVHAARETTGIWLWELVEP